MGSTHHSPGKAHSSMADKAAQGRDRLLVVLCVGLISTLAWVYLFRLAHQMSASLQDQQMMAAMGMASDRPWSASDNFFTFAMWAVMMVGMMAPSALPTLLVFAAAQASRDRKGLLPTVHFGLGYVAVWTGFSIVATFAQYALHNAALLSPSMAFTSPRMSGVILLGAGLYQLSRWKSSCLTHCRSPLGFLMSNWREGAFGAFQMGSRHGIYCLGCCWALMCLLFVVGVMNLLWIAILSALVLLEKLGPGGAITARLTGAAIFIMGIALMIK